MTTAATQLPSARPFTPEECAVLAAAGIIAEGEQAAVLAGKRRFTVDEYLAMIEAGILRKEERLELIDGGIIIMSPIGEYHEYGTDQLTMELVPVLRGDRATVRIQGSIRLNDRSRPEPDVAVLRRRPANEMGPIFLPMCIFSSKSPTALCSETAAQSWPGTPRPASRKYGLPTCERGK